MSSALRGAAVVLAPILLQEGGGSSCLAGIAMVHAAHLNNSHRALHEQRLLTRPLPTASMRRAAASIQARAVCEVMLPLGLA
jgi:hypothetical protein